MSKRDWIIGAVGLCLGLVLGSAATYFWVKSGFAPGFGQDDLGSTVPEPSEQDVRASFQSLLSEAGVDAEVARFRRTDWFANTVRLGPVDNGNGTVDLKPLTHPYKTYSVAYESELAFRGNGQIKENGVLMWSEGNSVDGQGWSMVRNESKAFQKGERTQVRGQLRYRLQGTQWQLESDCTIDAAR
jgi:hypothetical protein